MSEWSGIGSRRLAAVAVLAILGFPAGSPAAQQSAQQTERYTVTGAEVVLYNLAGELRVEPGTGSAVVVEVTRGGRDAATLRVETGPRGSLQTLRVIYPERRVVYRQRGFQGNSSLEVAPDGTFGNETGLGWLTGRHRVTVSSSGSGIEAWADLRVRVPRGQKLRLHHVVGPARIAGVEGEILVDNSAGSVEVLGIKGRLDIDTGSGSLTVSEVQGDVRLDTGSGSVEVSGVHGDLLRMDTGSGSVRVRDVTVDRLSADTGSGGVDLEGISAREILLDTGSGHIDLDLAADIHTLEVDTGSGGVTLTVPSKLGAEFDIETGSGSIDVDVPHQAFTIERDHVRGRIGDGEGRIHIDSGSGGVRVMKRTRTT